MGNARDQGRRRSVGCPVNGWRRRGRFALAQSNCPSEMTRARRRRFILEAARELAWSTGERRLGPKGDLGERFGEPSAELPSLAGSATGVEASVGSAISSVARFGRGQINCLDQAMAARRMLARRGLESTIVIGLAPGEAWGAHAWVVGTTGVVVGGRNDDRFTPVTAFRSRA